MKTRRRLNVEGREMIVVQGEAGSPGANGGHSSYCVGRKDVHLDLGAFRAMCRELPLKPETVLEMFGGSGWHSSAIRDLINPAVRHEAWDFDEDCVASMKASLPSLKVRHLDSYEAIKALAKSERRFEWVHADFNQFTWMKHLKAKEYRGVLSAIFRTSSELVTITDSAIFGLVRFKKNLAAYEGALGVKLDGWEDYYRAVDGEYRRLWSFRVIRVIHWSGMASMYLLERGDEPVNFPITKHTEHARVEILD